MARIEDMYYPPREPGFALKQEIKALQAQLDALRPVPVDQVPEAWKDGRKVIGWVGTKVWLPMKWDSGWDGWVSGTNVIAPNHVSLPLPPQEPDNA